MAFLWILGEFAGVCGIFYAIAAWKIWLLPLAVLLFLVCRVECEGPWS
jgi:hypothetical protein